MLLRRSFHQWEVDLEGGATSQFALHHDISAALLHDSIYGGKAQSGSLALFLGGEERLEDPRLRLAIHAHAGVADHERHIAAGAYELLTAAMVLVEGHVLGPKRESAPRGHSILGIDHEIHDHLLELAGVGTGMSSLRSEDGHQVDVLADQRTQQALHVLHDRVYVYHFQLEQLLSAEGQQLPGQGRSAVGGKLNGAALLEQRARRIQLRQNDLCIATDDHQQVVEVVSHTTGQASNGFHLLRLAELILERTAVGHILGDGFQNVRRLIGAADGASTDAHGNRAAIFAFPLHFESIEPSRTAEFVDQAVVLLRLREHIVFRVEQQHLFGGCVAQHRNQRWVYIKESAFQAGAVYPVHRALHQRTVTSLRSAQGLLIALDLNGAGHLARDECQDLLVAFPVADIL